MKLDLQKGQPETSLLVHRGETCLITQQIGHINSVL
jgi:hypothetical protein